jgi:hypothetical protein
MIEQTVLSALRRGERERYQIDEEGAARIALVLAAVVERSNAVAEMSRLLALIGALRNELASPSAAATLETIARENVTAVAIVAHHILRAGALDETRAFQAKEGRAGALRAPRIDSGITENSIRLAVFLDPASSGRIRHPWRGASGGAHDRNSQRDQESSHSKSKSHRRAATK